MKTTRIKSWEFVQESHSLSYRPTISKLIAGVLLLIFLLPISVLIGFKALQESGGAMRFFWLIIAVLLFGFCLYGLFYQLQSRRKPFRLDKRRDEFSNGHKRICRLSEISGVDVVRMEGVTDADNRRHAYYTVNLLLHNGEKRTTYLGANNGDHAAQYAQVLTDFLDAPSP